MPLCSTSSNPSDLLEQNASTSNVSYLIFFSANDPDTNVPWCPDCRDLLPSLESNFGEVQIQEEHGTASKGGQPQGYLLTKSRIDWRKTAQEGNDWRAAPWKVDRIPTVIKIEAGKEIGRLVEGECLDEDKFTQWIK